MNALTEFREFLWQEISPYVFIARLPAVTSIVSAVTTVGGNCNIHTLLVGWVKNDGVQTKPTSTWEPILPMRMVVQTLI